MKDRFPRSVEALAAKKRAFGLADLGIAFATLVWLAWFFGSTLTLDATSPEATVSADQRPNQIGSPIDGLVAEAPIEVGQRVEAGDLLVHFASDGVAARLDAAQGVVDALQREVASFRALVEIERKAVSENEQAQEAAMTDALQQVDSAQKASKLAESATDRAEKLFELGLASEQSMEESRAEGMQRQSEEIALEASIQQLEWDFSADQSARRARLEEVAAEIASLEGKLEGARSDVMHWRESLERTTIRSPVSGTVGALADIGIGSALRAGDYVATIVPDSNYEILATLPPADALGRIQPGQPCRLRLDAYPWTRFGALEGTVRRIGSEARDGRVAIVATIDNVPPGIALQHGLTGSLEIEIEQVSPAIATLRFLGRRPGR